MKKFPRIRIVIILLGAAGVLFAAQACVFLIPFKFLNFDQGVFALFLEAPQGVKSQSQFEKVLPDLQHDGVSYHFELVLDDGTHLPPYEYRPDIVIKTDGVVATKLAKSLSRNGPHPAGSSLSHHIYSTSSKDISIVLKQLEK